MPCEKGLFRALAISVVLWANPALAGVQHPNLARGFEAAKAYAVGEIDNINLFNGNLILNIPLGATYHVGGNLSYGLSLVYNGKAWDWHQEPGGAARAMAPWDSNAGFAWQLHFGKLIRPEASERNSSGGWIYVSPDGGEHTFETTLHPGEPITPGVWYTRDGSYLRLKIASPTLATIEFPSGLKHSFHKVDTVEHWLTRMEDAFGNWMTVTYPLGAASSEWLVADATGRSHRVVLADKMLDKRAVKFVSQVELAAFDGAKAIYALSYQSAELDRPVPHDPNTGFPIRWFFPLLTAVSLPDGSAWEMPVNFYSRLRDEQGISGQLVKLRLPTRGLLAWSYSRWRFPTDSVPDPDGIPQPGAFLEFTPGVASRRTLSAGGTETGKWTYTPALVFPAGWPTVKPITTTTTVVDPLGHRTVHYFGAFHGNGLPASEEAEAWHYGLPFSVAESDGAGRHVSRRVFEAGLPNPVRTDWVRYESDLAPGGHFSGDNPRVFSSRADWSGKTKTEVLSGFDGLGHYRLRRLDGNYRNDAGGPGNKRSEYTAFNLGRGTYPGSFTPLSSTDRWILGTFSEQWEEESWGRRKREYVFDELGFLVRQRDLLSTDGSRHANDSLRVLTREAGNVKTEAYYGGYFQQLGLGELAGLALPATAAAAFEMSYEYGQAKTRRYKDAPYFLANMAIDQNTGYPKSAKDIAGIETGYSYDTMGRRTWIKPAVGHDAWIEMRYSPATGTSVAQAFVYERPNDSPNGLIRESQLRFDAFGRLAREGRNTSAGWSYRDHAYDGAGNLSAISEWQAGAPAFWTSYENFDPFGRAERIVGPDGKILRLEYHGDSGLQRWFYVATSRDAGGTIHEQQSASAEDYDILGRTWRYQELNEAASPNLDAFYRYTSGGNLSEVLVVAPNGNRQRRSFAFDGRGFLTAEFHPETGETLYSQIDARGHANRKRHVASGLDLGFQYDSYERLLKVWDRSRVADLKVWTYGTGSAGDFSLGKVVKAVHFNRRRNPFAAGEQWIDVPVEESFVYAGRGGRVSARTTKLNNAYSFTQSASWGPLGELTEETYPRCATRPCAGLGGTRAQAYTYDRGDLKGIAGWGSLAYHDNGMLATANHANGVTDTIDKDPWQMPRPRNIRIGGAAPAAELGIHSFDGGGNLVSLKPSSGAQSFEELTGPEPSFAPGFGSIQETFFLYDAYGRLRKWNDRSGRSQDFDFDAFGNLVGITDFDGLHPPTSRTFAVSAATNQLSALVAYDPRGNLKTRYLGGGNEIYEWDLFDQLASHNFPAATHLYTADGERLWTLRYAPAAGQVDESFTLRGFGNQVLTVYRHQASPTSGDRWSWEEDYIYRGSQLFAKATSKPAPYDKVHFTLDHLGTPRVATGSNGLPLEGYHYLAFGEQHGGTLASTERIRFTAQERDANASGTADDLDYKHARYSSPNLGRFLTPDPQLGSIAAPQSWNRYAYAGNNPMNLLDPTGEYVTNCAQDDADCARNAAAFEETRQELLNNGNERLRAAAAAYGDPNTPNGITVVFGDPGKKADGLTQVYAQGGTDGSMSLVATVTIRPDLKPLSRRSAIAHEGSHVEKGQDFVASMAYDPQSASMTFDGAKNLTEFDLEMDAFRISQLAIATAQSKLQVGSCAKCVLGVNLRTQAEIDLTIKKILADADGVYKISPIHPGAKQFPTWN